MKTGWFFNLAFWISSMPKEWQGDVSTGVVVLWQPDIIRAGRAWQAHENRHVVQNGSMQFHHISAEGHGAWPVVVWQHV